MNTKRTFNIFSLIMILSLLISGCGVRSKFHEANAYYSKVVVAETKLSGQYRVYQSRYNNEMSVVKDQYRVHLTTLEGLDKFISDAMSGRYDRSENPGVMEGQAFISAVAEAYPETKGITDLAGKLFDSIRIARSNIMDEQLKLWDMFAAYDELRFADIVLELFDRAQQEFGNLTGFAVFPTHNLQVSVGVDYPGREEDGKLHGQTAYDYMTTVMMSKGAQEAFDTKEDEGFIPSSESNNK